MIPMGYDRMDRPGDKLATNPHEAVPPDTASSNLKNEGVGSSFLPWSTTGFSVSRR
jgi:hypothetical protein